MAPTHCHPMGQGFDTGGGTNLEPKYRRIIFIHNLLNQSLRYTAERASQGEQLRRLGRVAIRKLLIPWQGNHLFLMASQNNNKEPKNIKGRRLAGP